jgi:hypothetical protein
VLSDFPSFFVALNKFFAWQYFNSALCFAQSAGYHAGEIRAERARQAAKARSAICPEGSGPKRVKRRFGIAAVWPGENVTIQMNKEVRK